ncbi:hypothetical protein [Microscilla marina]|uniref:Uncharacterized protein n=1 Tax=Microscilla marina ATCC 23134 TaxID=313606 RepID=A1ZIB1_MICM2|nr:hypothetical protein [Microscilla marina]EAY29779.1 hypothetical protein M23134_05651 [Microscilla marina ATCC 23134]
MSKQYIVFLLSILCLFSCTKVPSKQQASKQEFSDKELRKFASIYNYLRLRPRGNPEMAVRDAVLKSSLSEKRFGEIMRAKFTQQQIEISATEQTALNSIRNTVKQTQLKQKVEDDKIIVERGMMLERYYAIMKRYKQSTFLQNRVYDLINSQKK